MASSSFFSLSSYMAKWSLHLSSISFSILIFLPLFLDKVGNTSGSHFFFLRTYILLESDSGKICKSDLHNTHIRVVQRFCLGGQLHIVYMSNSLRLLPLLSSFWMFLDLLGTPLCLPGYIIYDSVYMI